MDDKKRRAYIIGQTKGFDAKECDVAYVLDGYEQSPEAARACRVAILKGLDMAYEQKE